MDIGNVNSQLEHLLTEAKGLPPEVPDEEDKEAFKMFHAHVQAVAHRANYLLNILEGTD